MKNAAFIIRFLAFSLLAESQPPLVYFDFLSHNEETSQWNGTPYYTTNRAKIITLANYFQSKGITWNMQSDWVFLTNVLIQETPTLMLSTNNKNILRCLYEDKGVEMDPHAHESTYLYPDVVKLMDSIGLPESKVIGGTIYNDSNGINIWTNLVDGQFGKIFPKKFWKPDYMMGGGTPNHVADLKYYGFWNPQSPSNYLVHDTTTHLRHLGVGCEIKIKDTSTVANIVSQLKEVIQNVQSGFYPDNGFYLQTVFFEQGDLNNNAFYNKVVEVADSMNAIVLRGTAQWKTFKQAYTIWENNYHAQMFQWECEQIVTAVQTKNTPRTFSIFPNPVSEQLFINTATLTEKEISLYDILFRQIFHTSINSGDQLSIDISGLAPGIYFVQAGNLIKKFVKE
jgi:hypothetical protein